MPAGRHNGPTTSARGVGASDQRTGLNFGFPAGSVRGRPDLDLVPPGGATARRSAVPCDRQREPGEEAASSTSRGSRARAPRSRVEAAGSLRRSPTLDAPSLQPRSAVMRDAWPMTCSSDRRWACECLISWSFDDKMAPGRLDVVPGAWLARPGRATNPPSQEGTRCGTGWPVRRWQVWRRFF